MAVMPVRAVVPVIVAPSVPEVVHIPLKVVELALEVLDVFGFLVQLRDFIEVFGSGPGRPL